MWLGQIMKELNVKSLCPKVSAPVMNTLLDSKICTAVCICHMTFLFFNANLNSLWFFEVKGVDDLYGFCRMCIPFFRLNIYLYVRIQCRLLCVRLRFYVRGVLFYLLILIPITPEWSEMPFFNHVWLWDHGWQG